MRLWIVNSKSRFVQRNSQTIISSISICEGQPVCRNSALWVGNAATPLEVGHKAMRILKLCRLGMVVNRTRDQLFPDKKVKFMPY